MYSDIIPPKKRLQHTRTTEYNSVRFSSPHLNYSYTESTKGRKTPIILFMAALAVIGLIAYNNLYHSTRIDITPKIARFVIKEKIPLVLQGREKDALTYSLVYVPAGSSSGATTTIRNPFQAVATTSISSSYATNSDSITMTASTTGDTKKIIVINKSGGVVPLRKETRFDVNGVMYTLDVATQNAPTPKTILDKIATTTEIYRVMGFKGYPTYDSVYAVAESSLVDASTPTVSRSVQSTTTVATSAVSTVPPQDLLSLMPAGTLALQKSTIYDKLVDQSAVVVFDQHTLEEFLKNNIAQTEEYYKTLKPFGESISFDINILDYTLETSGENGKPVAFTSFMIEIVPKVDVDALLLQFSGFSKDTMNIIQKQVNEYMSLSVIYKPFWSDTVAPSDKIKIDLKEAI